MLNQRCHLLTSDILIKNKKKLYPISTLIQVVIRDGMMIIHNPYLRNKPNSLSYHD